MLELSLKIKLALHTTHIQLAQRQKLDCLNLERTIGFIRMPFKEGEACFEPVQCMCLCFVIFLSEFRLYILEIL